MTTSDVPITAHMRNTVEILLMYPSNICCVFSDENAQQTSTKRSTGSGDDAHSAKKRCKEPDTIQPQPTTSHHHDNDEHGNLFYYI